MVEIIFCEKSVVTSGRTLDHAAGVYDILSPLMTFGLEGRISGRVINRLSLPGEAQVLDIGCGTGSLSIQIAKKIIKNPNSFVIGLDAADRMLEVARKKASNLSNIRFDHAIAEALPYKDNSFDAIISTFFFHHINNDLKHRTLAESYRVLKSGGRFVVVDVDRPSNLWGTICAWSGYFLFQQDEIKENIQGKLTEAMEQSPFREWKTVSRHQGYISVFELIK